MTDTYLCRPGDPCGHCDYCLSDNGVDDEPQSLSDRIRAALLDTDAVRAIPPPDPLIAGYLMRDSLATLYGPSGGGKTFLSLDWAIHAAVMPWWNGNAIQGGPVIYVIAEGASGIGARIDAWTKHHVTPISGHPIHWLPQAVNLNHVDEVYAFIHVVAELNPALIVFDTLARCIVGADENSAKDVGLVVDHLDRIRRATGACVLVVHHTGKDGAQGARGSSALRAAMDTELELTATDDRATLKVTKQKDGAEPKPLRLTRVTAGESCVLVPAAGVIDDREISPGATATLETLREIQVPGGIATSVWEAAATAGRSQFYVHRARLLDCGLVSNIGTEKQPKYVITPADEGSDLVSSPGVGPAVRGNRPPGPGPDQSTRPEPDPDRTRTGPVDQGKPDPDPEPDPGQTANPGTLGPLNPEEMF